MFKKIIKKMSNKENKSEKSYYNIKGKDNNIFVKNGDELSKLPWVKAINISITGDLNKIILDKSIVEGTMNTVNIIINGNGNNVEIGHMSNIKLRSNIIGFGHSLEIKDTGYFLFSQINIGQTTQKGGTSGCSLKIGRNATIAGARFLLTQNNTAISVDEGCMISDDVVVMSSDAHKIFEVETKKVLNDGDYHVKIGKHVWIGRKTCIMKNAVIPDNTIIGVGAVVTKPFDEQYTVIAGNPAKIIKKGVNWSREVDF